MDRFNIVGDGMLDEGRFEEVLKPRSKVGVFSEFVRYVIYLFSFVNYIVNSLGGMK